MQMHKRNLLVLHGSNLATNTLVAKDVQQLNDAIKAKLKSGICHFIYQKADGAMREAYGTLTADYIPREHIPAGAPAGTAEPANPNPNTQKYFDLEAKAWRQYTIANVILLF